MKLRQLRAAIIVAEELNFTRAARRCNLSQPSLSRLIAELEQELGTALFRRGYHRIELTAEAEVFLTNARAAVSVLDGGIKTLQRIRVGTELRIAVGEFMFGTPFVRLLRAVRLAHPDLRLLPVQVQGTEGRALLLSGEVDLAVLPVPADLTSLTSVPLWAEAAHVFMSAAHELTSRDAVPLSALRGERLLRWSSDAAGRPEKLGRLCGLLDGQVGWHWLPGPAPTARQVWSLLSESARLHITLGAMGHAYPLPPSVVSRPLRTALASVPLVLAGRVSSPAAQRFLEVLDAWRSTSEWPERR